MIEFAPFLVALVVAALIRHLASRALVYRYYPLFERDKQRQERVKARIDAMDTSKMSQQKQAELKIQMYEEEGVSFRPVGVFFLTHLSLWLLSIVVVWVAASHVGGPFAEAIWWIPFAYVGIKLLFALPSTLTKQDGALSKLGPEGRLSAMGCIGAFVLLILLPVTVVYSLAPVGVITFVAVYWCLSWTLWRLFPYTKGDLPNVAMLFL